jgi:hypothetical protein
MKSARTLEFGCLVSEKGERLSGSSARSHRTRKNSSFPFLRPSLVPDPCSLGVNSLLCFRRICLTSPGRPY